MCYQKACDLDPDPASAWYWHALGYTGGGEVNGQQYTVPPSANYSVLYFVVGESIAGTALTISSLS